jgi:hypothetical protein
MRYRAGVDASEPPARNGDVVFEPKMTSSSTGEPIGRRATPKTRREATVSSPKISQLPAAEMRAAIDVQDVTGDRRGVGQVHDRIGDVLDRRRPTHR